jgi:NarL family two-component system response regulator YdfI
VRNIRDLQAFLEPDFIGKTIAISIIRGGKPVEIKVIIGERRRRSA